MMDGQIDRVGNSDQRDDRRRDGKPDNAVPLGVLNLAFGYFVFDVLASDVAAFDGVD